MKEQQTKTTPLIVHSDWTRDWGGQEMRTLCELQEMKKLGFRTGLIVPQESELANRAKGMDIPVYPVPFTSKFCLPSWKALFRVLRTIRPDVLNTHSSEDSWMAGCAARLCGVPLIARTRHVLAPISSAVSYNLFPHVIFACSESIRDQLIQQGVKKDLIIVQNTGIDEERFQYNKSDRDAIRRQYGIADDEILVGNVAFLRHYKGHPFIIETATTMPNQYKFMLVGEGGERPHLEKMIRDKGLEDRFILAGHTEQPEKYFSAFDMIFFSSNESEGISQSFIQGLLYGLPVLAVRTPSILEPLNLVQHHATVEYGDVTSAGEALVSLSNFLQRDDQAIENQRHAVAAKYGLKAMVDNILLVYAQSGVSV